MRTVFLLLFPLAVWSQTDTAYLSEIAQHRAHYKVEFLTEPRSPLTAADTAFLDFFPANPVWRLEARFNPTPDALPFDMLTYSGKKVQYRQYGELIFQIDGKMQTLQLYQNLRLNQTPEYKDYLFLPFKDLSNGGQTYGGGRYLDFRQGDIQEKAGESWLILDFNKCYNPYCAYSDGYNCPVPPQENHLPIAVDAGERQFKGEKKH